MIGSEGEKAKTIGSEVSTRGDSLLPSGSDRGRNHARNGGKSPGESHRFRRSGDRRPGDRRTGGRRSGAAAGRALGFLVLLALVALGAFWGSQAFGPEKGDPAPAHPAPETHGPRNPSPLDLGDRRVRPPRPADQESRTGVPGGRDQEPVLQTHAAAASPSRFQGSPGSIRGHIEIDSAAPFPLEWKLVIGPSRTLFGREHAVERTIEFHDGTQDFEVTGLPLGGYDVRAEAEGMNGYPVSVLLEKRASNPYVNLRIGLAGYVEGAVVDVNSVSVVNLEISLESLADKTKRTTLTDNLGRFRFERVNDGGYRLHFGYPYSPVADARVFQVQAPGIVLPPEEVPELGEIYLLALDPFGAGIINATVRGTGTEGGYVEGTTDEQGLLSVPNLRPGHYRLRVESPEGASERTRTEVVAGERIDVTVKFR